MTSLSPLYIFHSSEIEKNTKKEVPLSRTFFILPVLFFVTTQLIAQTTIWNGNESTEWNNANNWSAGVPDATDDVIITAGTFNPIISTVGAVAKSVTVNSMTILTITSSGATLNINGSTNKGILNNGTVIVQNSAVLNIGNISIAGNMGIDNEGTFNNNTDGQINIDRTYSWGIYNYSGTFNNTATITIGATASTGAVGLANYSIFNNNTGGQINIDRSTTAGLGNLTNGTFNNAANITIGAIASAGQRSIDNIGIFNNNTGGQISIDHATVCEFQNYSGSMFNNAATLTFGANVSTANVGLNNLGDFNNNTGGQINFDYLNGLMFQNLAGTFTNAANISFGSNSIDSYNIYNNATFSNNSGGTITSSNGLFLIASGKTVTNNGIITNNGIFSGDGTLVQSGTFTNNTTSSIAPGYNLSKLTVTGNFDLGNGTYDAEVNGTVQGTNYDWLSVSGTATITSNSKLHLIFYSAVVNGATFDVLTANLVSGTFAGGNVTYTNNDSGNVTDVTVTYPGGGIVRVTVNSPLPIELVDFQATMENEQIRLTWQTASELNNKGFYIERRTDEYTNGMDWHILGFVSGNGTTVEAHKYSFLDEKPLPGVNYYRLRQSDFDGREELSKVISESLHSDGVLRVFPNLVSGGEVTLILPKFLPRTNLEEDITVRLFSPAGQLQRLWRCGEGTNSIDVSEMASGIYILQAGSYFEKILVQN